MSEWSIVRCWVKGGGFAVGIDGHLIQLSLKMDEAEQ